MIILNISYDLNHSFISCILKKTLTQFLFVMTSRILMAEKSSPDLSSCALREGKEVGYILSASQGIKQNAHHSCVYAQCEWYDLAKHGCSITVPNIVLLSLVHVFEHVQRGIIRRVKI